MDACELCRSEGGTVVWKDADWRVVRVDDAAFPAYYRVISNHHVAEFGDLLAPERERCMALVTGVERVLREELAPTKMNLASLGNVVPHLHWHVVARFEWDSHFPQPIWGAAQRPCSDAVQRLGIGLAALDHAVANALDAVR
jgi:diadenosine tetraphosphate (Ap4A) HIT family hydrolase